MKRTSAQAVGGELYAYVSSIDRNYSDSSLFLETPLECYADCVKEEPETVAQIENFGKIAAGIAMKLARGLVK